MLTCASPQSRNFAFGLELGRGLIGAEASGGKLAEGAMTTTALLRLARARGVDMPIAAAVEALLEGRIDARSAVVDLLGAAAKGRRLRRRPYICVSKCAAPERSALPGEFSMLRIFTTPSSTSME